MINPTITEAEPNKSEVKQKSEVKNKSEVKKEGQPQGRRSFLAEGLTLARFAELFEGYNLASYQMLFSWSIGEEESNLVASIEREGIARKKGQTVYLLEYKWFLAWRAYAEAKYKVNIVVQAS